MYATMREFEERQLLSIVKLTKVDSKDDFDNEDKILDNPLDLLDQEKLMGDLERKRSLS